MTDITKTEMRDLLLEQARTFAGLVNRAPSPSPLGGGSSGGVGSMFNLPIPGFISSVNAVTDGMGRVATGALTTKDAFDTVSGFIGSFGSASAAVANALKQTGGIIFDINRTMRETGQYGVTLSGDLFAYNTAVTDAQLKLSEFSDIVAQSGKSFTGLGTTMDKGANMFLSVVSDIQRTDAAIQLKAVGVSAKELAEITRVSMMQTNLRDLQTAEQQNAARDAASSLAVELEKTAMITGKSRSDQLRAVEEQMNEVHMQAAIYRRGPEFGAAMQGAISKISAVLGPDIVRVVQEASTTGIRSKGAAETIASIGDEATVKAIYDLSSAIKSGNIAQTKEASDDLIAKFAKGIVSPPRLAATEFMPENYLKFTKLFADTFDKIRPYLEAAGYDPRTGTSKISMEEAVKLVGKEVESKITGKTPEGKELDPRAMLSRTLNVLDESVFKTMTGIVNKGLGDFGTKITALNQEGLTSLNKVLTEMSTPTGAVRQFEGALKGAVDMIKSKLNIPDLTGVKPSSESKGPSMPEIFRNQLETPTPNQGAQPKEQPKESPIDLQQFMLKNYGISEILRPEDLGFSSFRDELQKLANSMQEQINRSAEQKATTPAEATATVMPENTPIIANATLDDVKLELEKLNFGLRRLVDNTSEIASNSNSQLKATKNMSNNRLA